MLTSTQFPVASSEAFGSATLAHTTQKRMAQDALNRYWYPSLMMFGPSDKESVHSTQSMKWRIKINSNDELQKVTCYDGKGQTGESLDLVTGAIADLGWGYNFDDKISSCCFQGIWIL